MRKGITLVEVLISVIITLLLLSAIYLGYITLFKNSSQETVSATSQMEKLLGLELLRLDIEHAGFGLASNGSYIDLPIQWQNNTLTIRSVYDVSNQNTGNWGIYDCNSSSGIIGNFPSSTWVISLASNGTYIGSGNCTPTGNGTFSCSSNVCNGTKDKVLVFSVADKKTINNGPCNQPGCVEIEYSLNYTDNVPEYCIEKPFWVLERKVIKQKGGGRGTPLLYCVGNFTVRFDWDNNTDGIIEPEERNQNIEISNSTPISDVRSKLKLVRIYLLVQEGKYNPEYLFPDNVTVDNVTLSLPDSRTNPKVRHCRWKVIKLAVKPMDL